MRHASKTRDKCKKRCHTFHMRVSKYLNPNIETEKTEKNNNKDNIHIIHFKNSLCIPRQIKSQYLPF